MMGELGVAGGDQMLGSCCIDGLHYSGCGSWSLWGLGNAKEYSDLMSDMNDAAVTSWTATKAQLMWF